MGAMLQAQKHEALNTKEVAKIMTSMNYTNYMLVLI